MTQPSGWYDDPQDSSQLRYWDGVVWSSHITPKVSPTVAQSNIGMPYGVTPASARPSSTGSRGAQGPPAASGGFHPPGQGQGQQGQGQPDSGPQDRGSQGQSPQDQGFPGAGQQGGQWSQSGHPGSLAEGQLGWQSNPQPTTPDGVVLSGWWKRVLASIIDSIIVSILALPFAFSALSRAITVFVDYIQKAFAAGAAGSSPPVQPGAELNDPLVQVSLIVLAVTLVYEIAFLTRTGATPGKRVVGISVRLRDKPGPPPLAAVLKRTAIKEGSGLLGAVPNSAISFIASAFGLLDSLWPLWDDKKQAIHDKVGATNVVVGPQPKRDD